MMCFFLLSEIFPADKYDTEKCRHRIGWVMCMCWQRDGCRLFSFSQIKYRGDSLERIA